MTTRPLLDIQLDSAADAYLDIWNTFAVIRLSDAARKRGATPEQAEKFALSVLHQFAEQERDMFRKFVENRQKPLDKWIAAFNWDETDF